MDNPVSTSMCYGSQGLPGWLGAPLPPPPHSEAGSLTTTSVSPTASRSHAAAQPCMLPATAVVEVVVTVTSMVRDGTHYCIAVRTPSMGASCMIATSRCSVRCWRRMVSPHLRQAGTSNLMLHDNMRAMKATRSIGSVVKQGRCPQWR
jgi:hypothetical protein